MPQVPIIMPQLGESIAEATIVDIKVKPGDEVVDDQEIIDVETNKAVMGVTTPCKGKIDKITVELKETYPVGTVLGYVEASEQDAARFAKHAPPPPQQNEVAEEIPARADQEVAPARGKKIAARDGDGERAGGLPVPAITKGATFMSPRVRARMAELQLTTADLAGIMGTGAGNRVTIKDLESFLHKIENQTAHEASKIRAGVADAMRRSWTRPLSTIGSSVNLDPVLQDRQSRDPKPGLGLYALARARACAGRKSRRGGEINRKPRCAIELNRRRNCGGSRRRNHGAGHSGCRKNFACRSHDKIQGIDRTRATAADFA